MQDFEGDEILNDSLIPHDTVASPINDLYIQARSRTKPVRHAFKIYWFSGCLHESKFKLPERPLEQCPIAEHAIDYHRVDVVDVFKRDFVKPSEDWIERRRQEVSIASMLGDMDRADRIAKKTQEIIDGKKHIWVETIITPREYDRYLKRIQTKIERMATADFSKGRHSEKEIKLTEWAGIQMLRDPMKAWYVLDKNDLFIFTKRRSRRMYQLDELDFIDSIHMKDS